MKHLVIRNFGPIEDVEIDLKRINLIIGPQSSGKSTVLKVACFCDWMERQIELTQNPDRYCQSSVFVKNLIGFHKLNGYLQPNTFIRYENDALAFEYTEKEKKCFFVWKKSKRWNYKRAKIAYIPSERNIVAAIPNWYQISMNNDNILDFMKEWEFARKEFSNGEPVLNLPIKYVYNPVDKTDSIKLTNGKEMELSVASSGVQSLAPLYIMLCYLTSIYFKKKHSNVEEDILRDNLTNVVNTECGNLSVDKRDKIVDAILTPHHTDLFIEEPEAHIFPSTQKSFVYSLVNMLNGKLKHSCFIATHSPYILTSFNNLILAGETVAEFKEKSAKVFERISKRQMLRYDDVAAYEIQDGRVRLIMDDGLRLISADAIDTASLEIGNDFDYLLNV